MDQAVTVAAEHDTGRANADELRLLGSDIHTQPMQTFLENYSPNIRKGFLIFEAGAAPYFYHYESAVHTAENIPTVADFTRQSGPSAGAYLQFLPHQKFRWIAVSAQGWLLAKLKNVGELDFFMAPIILSPVCRFDTKMRSEYHR